MNDSLADVAPQLNPLPLLVGVLASMLAALFFLYGSLRYPDAPVFSSMVGVFLFAGVVLFIIRLQEGHTAHRYAALRADLLGRGVEALGVVVSSDLLTQSGLIRLVYSYTDRDGLSRQGKLQLQFSDARLLVAGTRLALRYDPLDSRRSLPLASARTSANAGLGQVELS